MYNVGLYFEANSSTFAMLITLNLVDELIYGEQRTDALLIKYLDLAKQID